ncbi:MAG: zinc ribbon domain-containing protein [Clostridia bacterium]|nr:zinc ribbon domain-containing protein [Clostridia bacterium]
MKICKNCGEVNQSSVDFCCNCGKDVFEFAAETVCQNCGNTNASTYTHCIHCGEPLQLQLTADAQSVKREIETIYSTQLAEVSLKETAVCANCGQEVPVNSLLCTGCGAPTYQMHDHRVVKRKICSNCEQPNLPTSTLCSMCFASLKDAKMQDFQLVYTDAQSGGLSLRTAVLENQFGKYKICNNCGSMNKLSEDFCHKCGLKLGVEEQVRYCVNCGAENQPDSHFCIKCQWSFDGQAADSNQGVWTCKKCNHLNQSNSDFCTNCGSKKAK